MARSRLIEIGPETFPAYKHLPLRTRPARSGQYVWILAPDIRKDRHAHLFVDEAGDATLFNRTGRCIVGEEGCSKFFILGLAWVLEPDLLNVELESLRSDITKDQYLRKIPSVIDPLKTPRMFHAKDDCPEVRREVFRVLMRHPIQFYACLRDKQSVAQWVKSENLRLPGWRYTTNTLYDFMTERLVMERLHKDKGYTIYFSRRGASDRTEALRAAVSRARDRFYEKFGIAGAAPVDIVPAHPWDVACLQATDYLLWALQRLYERSEDRYIDYVWPAVRLILDQDGLNDRGTRGCYYTQQGPKLASDLMLRRTSRRI